MNTVTNEYLISSQVSDFAIDKDLDAFPPDRSTPSFKTSIYLDIVSLSAISPAPSFRYREIPSCDTMNVAQDGLIRKHLDDLFDFISAALDDDLQLFEKSNSFDCWKDALNFLGEELDSISSKHRRLLGTLIVTVKDKDIGNFAADQLNVFLRSSNTLRQPRIDKTEIKRLIADLISTCHCKPLSLSTDYISEEHEEQLDSIRKKLLEQARIKDGIE